MLLRIALLSTGTQPIKVPGATSSVDLYAGSFVKNQQVESTVVFFYISVIENENSHKKQHTF